MAGDLQGVTHFTGVSVTSTPGLSQATWPVPVLHVAGGARVAVDSGSSVVVASGTTVTLQTPSFSIRTVGAHSSLASVGPTDADSGQVAFIFRASGLSLLYRSGNTVYYFNSDASGAA